MSEENDVVVVDEAAEAAAATGKKRAPKEKPVKEKPPAPKFWITGVGNKPTSIYGQIQAVVFANPGLTEAELLPHLLAGVKAPKNEVNEDYLGGYMTGGIRRGYLTNNEAEASTVLNVKVEAVKEPKEKKEAGPTGAGDAILKALEAIITENSAERTTPISGASLSEKTGKTLPVLARTLKKLEKDGHVVLNIGEDKVIATIALTDKAAPAAEPSADIA